METEKFSVWHYNGQGIYSQWYRDQTGLTRQQAETLKKELEEKSFQGWYAHVDIFPDDVSPNDEE